MSELERKLTLQVGGQLNPHKHIYISRQDVEDEIYETLLRGDYCNILSSRQVGKSSIMMKVALRLKEQEFRVISLDIAGLLGSPATADEWFMALSGD